MTTPAFYKPPAYPTSREIPLKPRSKWRQALLDAAYRDIDACTCHTDFVFAIVDHSKAWLAELNQWNEVPTDPVDLATWKTFAIEDARIILQAITPNDSGKYIPKFWFNFRSSTRPGRLSLVDLANVLPWTTESALRYKDGSIVATVYRHSKAHASGGSNQASSLLNDCAPLLYIDRLVQHALVKPYQDTYYTQSIAALEMRAAFVRTSSAATAVTRDSWLGRRMLEATQAVQNAATLFDIAQQVTKHMSTWYAAAQKWENGPPDKIAEKSMLSYRPEIKWSYGKWMSDDVIGRAGAEGPELVAVALFDPRVDPHLLAKVITQVPLGIVMDHAESKLRPDDGRSRDVVALRMIGIASSSYCALGRRLTVYKNTRTAFEIEPDHNFYLFEKNERAPDVSSAIGPIFNSLDL